MLAAAGVSKAAVHRAVAAGQLVRVRPRVLAEQPLPHLPRFLVTDQGPAPATVAWIRSALMSHGDAACAAGETAAVLRGWDLLHEPRVNVRLNVRHGARATPTPGVTVHRRRGGEGELVSVLPGTAPLRVELPASTVLTCAARLPRLDAVVLLDSALRSGVVDLGQLWAAYSDRACHPGTRRVAAVLSECDPHAGSVLESLSRILFRDADLPAPLTQLPLDGGRIRADFAWPEARLVVEVDGARWHPDAPRDQARDNRLAVLGWRVLRFTWGQVVNEPWLVVDLVREALTQ